MPARWSFLFSAGISRALIDWPRLSSDQGEFRFDMAHVRSVRVDRSLDFSRRFIGHNATQCRSSSFSSATFQRSPSFISKKKSLPLARLSLRVIYHLTSSRKLIFSRGRALRSTWLDIRYLKEYIRRFEVRDSRITQLWDCCMSNLWSFESKFLKVSPSRTDIRKWQIDTTRNRCGHFCECRTWSVDRKLKLRH